MTAVMLKFLGHRMLIVSGLSACLDGGLHSGLLLLFLNSNKKQELKKNYIFGKGCFSVSRNTKI